MYNMYIHIYNICICINIFIYIYIKTYIFVKYIKKYIPFFSVYILVYNNRRYLYCTTTQKYI